MPILRVREQQQKKMQADNAHLSDKNVHLVDEVSVLGAKVEHYGERIESQQKEIERLGRTAKTILNNVNHELRLPVGNVMNFAEMLYTGLEKYDKNHLKMLSDEVYKSSTRLSTMILNMLDLAMLSAAKIELNKSQVDLGAIITERVEKCKKIYLDNKPIEFKLDIEPGVILNVDPNYMRQVIDNLTINALTYSREGRIRIKFNSNAEGAEFNIADDGIGIPKTEIYDIFEAFKVSSKTSTPASGRGVGLSLCKTAIEAHGGYIRAESQGTFGASFIFYLPKGV